MLYCDYATEQSMVIKKALSKAIMHKCLFGKSPKVHIPSLNRISTSSNGRPTIVGGVLFRLFLPG